MRNRPHGFDIYLVNIKTMRKIAPIFVAFSEKLNVMITSSEIQIQNISICSKNLYDAKICRSVEVSIQFLDFISEK